MVEPYDPRYLRGIEHFNRRAYFDAHEEWESLWQERTGEDRTFYQGLIQVAVCLHHVGRQNMRGASKLHLSSCDYLQPFRPWHAGLDLDSFLRDVQQWWVAVVASAESDRPGVVDPLLVPQITLSDMACSNPDDADQG